MRRAARNSIVMITPTIIIMIMRTITISTTIITVKVKQARLCPV